MQVPKQVSDAGLQIIPQEVYLPVLPALVTHTPKLFCQPASEAPRSIPSLVCSGPQDRLSPGDRCSGASCELQGRSDPHTITFGQLPPDNSPDAGSHPTAHGKGRLATHASQVLQGRSRHTGSHRPVPS